MRALILALALSACAATATMRDGRDVAPPPGWTDYCDRNPADPSC